MGPIIGLVGDRLDAADRCRHVDPPGRGRALVRAVRSPSARSACCRCSTRSCSATAAAIVQLGIIGNIGLGLLVMLLLLKPLVTAACLASGAPGGLFTPTFAVGVLLAGVGGALWGHVWHGSVPGSYALIGGGAFLAAAMQGPLAGIVLVLELTGHLELADGADAARGGRGDGALAQARRRLDLLGAAGLRPRCSAVQPDRRTPRRWRRSTRSTRRLGRSETFRRTWKPGVDDDDARARGAWPGRARPARRRGRPRSGAPRAPGCRSRCGSARRARRPGTASGRPSASSPPAPAAARCPSRSADRRCACAARAPGTGTFSSSPSSLSSRSRAATTGSLMPVRSTNSSKRVAP